LGQVAEAGEWSQLRIKRLQLHGFKSCKDRAVIDFPVGITGVVGPNGCGKSNIVDALRWVLGEQSAKHLRGQSMEDVIFAGNDRHPQLGMAEVTITFDNEGKLEHLEEDRADDEPSITHVLRDVPEIEVTRRLFRSGESEYLLNGRTCRLRDITELFLGTGVGTKAYSIIEQGRVGQIVGAKPEDLRLFIEEAAGTTLFRSRKLAAERKIERTRDNLLRVNDIVGELDRQANTLRRQARGAVRYTELKEREERLDRQLAAHRLRNLDDRGDTVQVHLDEVLRKDRTLREETEGATRERDEARERQAAAEVRGDDARKTYYERKGRVSELEQERGYLESRVNELGRMCEEATQELGEVAQRLDLRRDEESVLRADQVAIVRDLEAASGARVSEERTAAEIESALIEISGQVEDCKARLVDGLAREASLKNERAGLQQQRETNGQRRERLREEWGSLGTLAHKLTNDLASCQGRLSSLMSDLDSTSGGKESTSMSLGDVLSRKAEIERRAESGRTAVASLSARHQSLRELSESFEGYGDGVRAFMSNGGRERTGATAVIADVIDIENGYERAVAAVMQDRLQYVVVPDADAGVRGASYLRETKTGRASFIPREPRTVPAAAPQHPPPGYSMLSEHVGVRSGYEGAVANLLSGVVIADNLESATNQWKLNGTYVTFVTREGEILDPRGVITGGSGRPVDESLLARKAELRRVADNLEQAKLKARVASEDFERITTQAQAVSEELAQLDRQLHELTINRVAVEGDLRLQRQNLTRSEERAQSVQEELEALEEEDGALRRRLAEIGQHLEELSELLGVTDGQRAELQAERDRLAAARAEKTQRLEQLKISEAELRQKRESGEARLQAIRSALEELGARHSVLESRLGHDARERDAAAEKLSRPDLDPVEVRREMEEAERAFEDLRREAESMRTALGSVQKRLDEIADILESNREERSRLELALKECSLERQSIADGLRDRLGIGPEDLLVATDIADNVSGSVAALYGKRREVAQSVFGPVPPWEAEATPAAQEVRQPAAVAAVGLDLNPEQMQEELERIRDSIRRLGTVNVGAVTELEELEGRLTEMTGQRDDLEKSIEDLRNTISRLNRMSRQRFQDTFVAVNDIFKDLFPKLFQGGKAWLELTDENNLLETGVEIFVRPPGKKVGNLNLLSGGEKALTAVSLIFSLFLFKPSPFCVLDEVDAPLDDANIGRFAGLVSDMCDRSQFVLITHNKRTMETCDVLYGVTMQEPGVTKIVSVEIER
jgi:chromosome segregation protein